MCNVTVGRPCPDGTHHWQHWHVVLQLPLLLLLLHVNADATMYAKTEKHQIP